MNTPIPGATVSVVTPLGQAFERMVQTLFRPFDLGRWLAIGFCAWLASLGESWGGGGGGWSSGGSRTVSGPRSLREFWGQTSDYVVENLSWLVPVVVLGLLFLLALGLLILWLSSRGQFMFLHNVATNRPEVALPWNVYRQHGNHLFLFRFVLGMGGFVVLLPPLIAGVGTIVMMANSEAASVGGVLVAVAGLGIATVLGLCLFIVQKLTTDFVVPLMRLRTPRVRSAWGELGGLVRAQPGPFVLYLLLQLVLHLALGCLVLAVVLLTCCLAGCLLAIPYLGTVLMLPVLVFLRAYSACFLAQFGPDHDVFFPR